MADDSAPVSDFPYFEESENVGYIDRPPPGPMLPLPPPPTTPPNVGQIIPPGAPPQPAAPPGPGANPAIQPTAPVQVARPGGAVAPGVTPTAPAAPAAAQGGFRPQPQGGGAPLRAPAGGALAAGVPAGGIGPNASFQGVPEEVALGTGEPGNSGIIGDLESGDDPGAVNYINDATHTASGLYMITNTNWQDVGPRAGIDTQQFPSAVSTMQAGEDQARQMQRQVAGVMYREQGFAPWAPFNYRIAEAVGYTGPMDPTARQGRGRDQSTAGMQGQIEQMSEQELRMARQLPGMISTASTEEQASLKRQQEILEKHGKQIEADTQLYRHQKELQAQQRQREAEQLQSDDDQMTAWAQRTPTRQAVYASAMHAMPLLALLTAIGGAATGAHGMLMLGALKGVVDGVNTGAENQYEDAMNTFKLRWEALKEHAKNTQTIYEKFAESYGDRADGYIKAADMTRQVMNDKLSAEQLKIQNSYAGIQAVDKIMDSLSKTVAAMSKALEFSYAQNIDPQTVDYMARLGFKNPGEMKQWYNFRQDPQSKAELNAVRNRMVYLAKIAGVSPEQAGEVPLLSRQFASRVGQHDRLNRALHEYAGRFTGQAEIVKQYLLSGAAATGWGPAINKVVQYIRGEIVGDPHFTEFENAVYGLAREHGRIIQGAQNSSAQLTNAANQRSDELLNQNMSVESILANIPEMRKEIDLAVYYSDKEQRDLEETSQYLGLPEENKTLGDIGLGTTPLNVPGEALPRVKTVDDYNKLKASLKPGQSTEYIDPKGQHRTMRAK